MTPADTPRPPLSQYRFLAAAVVHRAIIDATDPTLHPEDRQAARIWLSRPSAGLRFWCDVLGWDADWLRQRMREQRGNAETRAA